MSNAKPQAISGVSAGTEAEVMTAYPSIASGGAGQAIGRLCDAVPLRTNGVAWPRLLLAILFWPIVVPIARPRDCCSTLCRRCSASDTC